jgi:exopolysaccharide production protein ExoQ
LRTQLYRIELDVPTTRLSVGHKQPITLARVLRIVGLALHCATLLVLAGGIIPLWRLKTGHTVDPEEGDFVQRVLLLILLTGAIVVAVRSPRQLFTMMQSSDPLVLGLVALAFVSVAWSVAPEVTLRRAAALTLTAVYGLALAYRYHPSTVLHLVTFSLGVIVVLSLLLVFLVPDWGVMSSPHEGSWQGVFVHKNILGRWSAITILLGASLLFGANRRIKFIAGILMGLSTCALLGSRSVAPLVALAPAALVPLIFMLWRRSRWWQVALILETPFVALLIGVLTFVYRDAILSWLGRDATLTGRTYLWSALIPFITQRWISGYGYGAFWLGQDATSGIVWSLAWQAPHSHSFWLDVLLGTGVLGLVLWSGLLALAVRRGLKVPRSDSTRPPVIFGLSFVLFAVIYGIGESTLLQWTSLGTVLLIWTLSWPRNHISMAGIRH